MLTVPAFRSWRPIWDAALGSLTLRLDQLAAERQKGRGSPPQVGAEDLRRVGSDRVQTLFHGGRQPSVKEFLRVMQELQPLLRAAVWPRWLLLESGDVPGEKQNLDVGAIRALREQGVPADAWPAPIGSAAKSSRYIFLVDDERRLVADAERLGSIPRRHDDASSLSLLCCGLTFSINVTEFKLDTLAEQAARLINAENVLGATLVVRSMLEHHAVAVDSGKKLRALWNRIERAAPSVQQISDVFREAEKQIARVLAGTPGSRERSAAWRNLWEATVRKHYNVLDPIRAIDPDQPGFLRTYGLLSHIAHGTVVRAVTCSGRARVALVQDSPLWRRSRCSSRTCARLRP